MTFRDLLRLFFGGVLVYAQSGALQERSEYEAAFRKWAIKMHKQTLAKKMHKDWIPQMNVSTGKTYFFNLKTGESSEEHPNVEVGRATERKQRGIADKAIEKRLAKLRDYEATLLQALRDQMAQAEQILAQQIADHMDAWRGAVLTHEGAEPDLPTRRCSLPPACVARGPSSA
eukprot:6189504-Pleurochrysis_carterae.AAC.5